MQNFTVELMSGLVGGYVAGCIQLIQTVAIEDRGCYFPLGCRAVVGMPEQCISIQVSSFENNSLTAMLTASEGCAGLA